MSAWLFESGRGLPQSKTLARDPKRLGHRYDFIFEGF